MSIYNPMALLFGATVFAVILIGLGGAILTAWQSRKGKNPHLNHDDAFWKENGDTWLGP